MDSMLAATVAFPITQKSPTEWTTPE